MLYRYKVSDKYGKIIEGEFEADTLNQVLQFLQSKNYHPIGITVFKPGKVPERSFWGGINITDKVFLTKYLALMLKVGTDLLSAIDILIADFDKPAMRNFLLEVRDNLNKGRPFYIAFKSHPKIFSNVFANLIQAGEKSGKLEKTFEDLSISIEKEADLRGKIISALIYPLILLVIASSVLLFLVVFALPKIAAVFSQSGIKPPLFSRIVFAIGLFVNENLGVLMIALFGTIAFLFYFFLKTKTGDKVINQILTHAPIVRKLYRDIAIQRFAATLSSLIGAGLPIIQALNATADAVSSTNFKIAINRIANEGLTGGLTLGESFKREEIFPKVVSNLVAISEKAGHLENVLETLADFYAHNIDASIKTLVSFLEPIMLIMMGIVVAFIALSIIVPIYQLTSHI